MVTTAAKLTAVSIDHRSGRSNTGELATTTHRLVLDCVQAPLGLIGMQHRVHGSFVQYPLILALQPERVTVPAMAEFARRIYPAWSLYGHSSESLFSWEAARS